MASVIFLRIYCQPRIVARWPEVSNEGTRRAMNLYVRVRAISFAIVTGGVRPPVHRAAAPRLNRGRLNERPLLCRRIVNKHARTLRGLYKGLPGLGGRHPTLECVFADAHGSFVFDTFLLRPLVPQTFQCFPRRSDKPKAHGSKANDHRRCKSLVFHYIHPLCPRS